MFEATRRAVVFQVEKLKMQFSQREGLPFGEILSSGSVLRILEEQKAVFRDRIFSPVVTLAAFVAQVTREDLGDLYKLRWTVEVDLKFIKEIMQMDILRCHSPEMVQKEIGVHLLTYNLIRTVMAQAAERAGIVPNTISFKGTLQQMDAFTDKIVHAVGDGRTRLLDEMLRAIAYHRIGNRPGRSEPRAVKRRPKPYARLNEPRAMAKLSLEKYDVAAN